MNRYRRLIQRMVSVLLAAGLIFFSGNLPAAAAPAASDEFSERESQHAELAMTAAAEGMVLLENKNQALPIAASGCIALFGGGAVETVKGGTGSGDVNNRYTVSVWEGFKEAGYVVTSGDWLNAYEEAVKKARAENTDDWFGTFYPEEMEISDAAIEAAKTEDTDTAVYVISRISGEGTDRTETEGDYYLSETERSNLRKVGAAFEKVIVVLNVGGIIDTGFFSEIDGLDALLLMSQGGMEGGSAVVKVLNGEITPSGKLTDTWAEAYADYPSSETFGANDGDLDQENYSEGIYVGYRYFDSFNVTPAYAFGYGESYTSFDLHVDAAEADADTVSVTVTVTNTGDTWAGKEVVQIYFSAPDGTLEKPYQELAAYAKTDTLSPGESQTLVISYRTAEMSSYSEEMAAYILEAGDYILRVGNSSRTTHAAARIRLDETVVTEQLSNQLAADREIEELSRAGAVSYSYEEEAQEIAAAEVILLTASEFETLYNASAYDDETVTAYVSETTQREYLAENLGYEPENKYHGSYREVTVELEGDFSDCTLKDVYDGTVSIEEFVSGMTVSEMADLVIGGSKLASASGQSAGASSDNLQYAGGEAIAAAEANSVEGAAGETAGIYIESRLIPNIELADGPAGLRLTQEYEDFDGQMYYQFCTAWPVGTLLAQSWNTELVEQVGAAIGKEMVEYGVTIYLAPGMNIHRNPLCGRSFEYFSEDPFLTGTMGIAETAGVQSIPGIGVSIKHYAANNQESNRAAENNTIGERTFREIYLKGFEMVVKGADPMCIMTSYNLNNGIPTADDYDLLTDVTRGEWGYDGLIMSDWGGGQSSPSISMHAGNDLIMPGVSVEDITVRAFADEEPVFGDDDVYPAVTAAEDGLGVSVTTCWGEFIPDAEGDQKIIKTAETAVYESAVREDIGENGELISVPVSELLKALDGAASVTDNEDGTTTVVYTGFYEKNNITLGDLQKSTIHILNMILQSLPFADMFEDVEAESYTAVRADQLIVYLG